MNTTRKSKLIEYLYPSTQAIDFMFDDFYLQLLMVLPKKVCFSVDNMKQSVRKANLELAIKTIGNFLDKNPLYKSRYVELFSYKDFSVLINDILIGYVLYLTNNINRGTGADVFADKRSVCYSKTSILDWL